MLTTSNGAPGSGASTGSGRERSGALSVVVRGARGSLPAAGPGMARYGGETSCVEVRAGDRVLLLDAGSGIAGASAALLKEGVRTIDVALTHLHFDHICGMPFIAHLSEQGCTVRVWLSERFGPDIAGAVGAPFSPPNFPVRLADMPGTIEWHGLPERGATELGPFTLRTAALSHPGGATGFRVEAGRAALAYVMDHEPGTDDAGALALIDGADLALMDATYTPEEIARYRGWGHGDWRACGRLARDAGAKRWALFHHHYGRDDAALEQEGKRAGDEFGALVAFSGARYALGEEQLGMAGPTVAWGERLI